MNVRVDTEIYVLIRDKVLNDFPILKLQPQLIVRERQGTTIMTTESLATANGFTTNTHRCRKFSIQLHRNMKINGFLGEIVHRLAGLGVHAFTVSGFYLDHIYIPVEHVMVATDLLVILRNIAMMESAVEPWQFVPSTTSTGTQTSECSLGPSTTSVGTQTIERSLGRA